jgi:Na+-driven multidrug efflux pump
MNFAINQGFSQTVRIIIWKAIREGAINKAKNRAFLGFLLSIFLALAEWLCFFALKSIVMNSMLKDDLVKVHFLIYSDYYSLKLFLDVFLVISIDILKALLKFRVSFNLHIMGFYMGAIILMGYFSGFEPMKLIEGLWIGYMLAEISIIIIAFVYLCFLVNWKIEINKICLNKLRRNLNKT